MAETFVLTPIGCFIIKKPRKTEAETLAPGRGSPPPPFNKPYYVKRLAYRIQELAFGVDSNRIDKRLSALCERDLDKPARERKRLEVHRPATGTRLMREWNGQELHVTVLEDGFEYKGERYTSLSAIARKITGTRWNGLVFFGIKRDYRHA